MKIASRGFTVIEVMLVLSISTILFISMVTTFQGRRQQTEFSQAMYDIQSKIQSYVNQASNSAIPGFQEYTCIAKDVGGGVKYPRLQPGGGTSSQACIFLGRAIQVIPDEDTIYAYPVLGLRTFTDSSGKITFPTSAKDAHAQPAMLDDDTYVLVEEYPLLNGLKVVSAKVSNVQSDLLSLYTSLQNKDNTSGNEILATANAITFGSKDDASSLGLRDCIQNGTTCGGSASDISQTVWKLCLSNGNRSAQLSVQSTASGVTTRLNMDGCPS